MLYRILYCPLCSSGNGFRINQFIIQDSCKGCIHKVRACAKAVCDLHIVNAARHVTIARGEKHHP